MLARNLCDTFRARFGINIVPLSLKNLAVKYMIALCLLEIGKSNNDEKCNTLPMVLERVFSSYERRSFEFAILDMAGEWSNDLEIQVQKHVSKLISFDSLYKFLEEEAGLKIKLAGDEDTSG